MNSLQKTVGLSVIILAIVALTGCKEAPDKYQYGPMSATGTLIRADVSLIRRGSHSLIIGGKAAYYVESRTQNLSQYEGRSVYITGTLEPNNDTNDLPIFLAEKIDGPTENEDLKRFEVPSLNVRLGIPTSWTASVKGGIAHFSLPGEVSPLLTIRQLSGTSLPTGGSTLFIKNRRTTRINTGGGSSDVYILDKNVVMQLHFDPASQSQITTKEEGDIIIAQFERILSSISFLNDRENTVTGTGSIDTTVCGGEAGVLCATGYFCNISDLEHRMGTCKKNAR